MISCRYFNNITTPYGSIGSWENENLNARCRKIIIVSSKMKDDFATVSPAPAVRWYDEKRHEQIISASFILSHNSWLLSCQRQENDVALIPSTNNSKGCSRNNDYSRWECAIWVKLECERWALLASGIKTYQAQTGALSGSSRIVASYQKNTHIYT